MFKVGGHGIGEGGIKTHAEPGLTVIAGRIFIVHIIPRQVIGHGKIHARLGKVLPHSVRLGETLDFNIHGAVDQGRRLLDGQEHAIFEGKNLLGIIEVRHCGFKLGLVFNRHAWGFFKPVLGGKLRRLEPGLVGTGSGKQGRHKQQRQKKTCSKVCLCSEHLAPFAPLRFARR